MAINSDTINNDAGVFIQFWEGLKPTPLLKVSQWSDNFRFLSSTSSAEPGKWRTDRAPYLREVLDNLSPTSPYQEIVVQKSVQLGFTEAALNAVGCYMDIAPCPILYVMPTIEMAKGISKERIDAMIDASPALAEKVRPPRERDSGNTILGKSFPGGVLVLAGANSGSSLRSRPVRLLILDEVDAYPVSIGEEGSPISLAEKRTVTFSNRKIFKISTPTSEGASVIVKAIEGTDKRKYFVPLPCCGVMQTLEFSNLRWIAGNYEDVWYECAHCGGKVYEKMKTKFLAAGEWRPTDEKKISRTRVGYIINGLYSPVGWMGFAKIAQEWDETNGNSVLIAAFTNTILGEAYSEKGEVPEWKALYERRENYPVYSPPADVVLLTAGVDVQKDRLEVEIVGWCPGRRSYSIDYRIIPGDTSASLVWDELAKIVDERWLRTDGIELTISRMCVDSGYNTTEVYAFCRRFDPSRVVPTKGNDKQNVVLSPPKAVDRSDRSGKTAGVTMLWNVGVNILKSELYGWLRLGIAEDGTYPPGYCHFPTAYDEHYFKMLTAEAQVKKIIRGYPVYVWEKKFPRNEALDCRVLARAAAEMLGVSRWRDQDWKAWADSLQKRTSPAPPATDRRRGSGFWDR